MACHSHFPKGSHVFIILRNGTKFEDIFITNEGHGEIQLKNRGRVELKRIRSIGYRILARRTK